MDFVIKQLIEPTKIAKYWISQSQWVSLCDVKMHYKSEVRLFSNDEVSHEEANKLSSICKYLAHSCKESFKSVLNVQNIIVAPSNDNFYKIYAEGLENFSLTFKIEGGKIVGESHGFDIGTLMPRGTMMKEIDNISKFSTQTSLTHYIDPPFTKFKMASVEKAITLNVSKFADKVNEEDKTTSPSIAAAAA